MKFKDRSLLFLILLNIITVAASLFVWHNSSLLDRQFFTSSRELNFPDNIAGNGSNDIFIIENGWKTITCFGSDGKIRFSLQGGSRAAGGFYEAWAITVDNLGYFYILNAERNIETGLILKEEIQRYRTDGSFDRSICSYTYDTPDESNAELDLGGRLIFPKVSGNSLYYLYRTDIQHCDVIKTDTNTMEKQTVMHLSSAVNIADTVYLPNEIIYSGKNGKVYKTSHSGNTSVISSYPFFIPGPLASSENGSVLVSDLGTQKILLIGTGDKVSTLLSKDSIKASGYPADNVLFRQIAFTPDNSFLTVDESNNRIIKCNSDGSISGIFAMIYFPASVFITRAFIMLSFLIIIIAIITDLRIIYISIPGRRIPLFFKLGIVFIPVFIISIAIISSVIFITSNSAYEAEILSKLAILAQNGSRQIDGDALGRLSKPAHFMNEDYRKLQAQMNAILNDNKDEWNKNIYSVLYKNYNGIYYYTVDLSGYYGVLYPYARIQQIHKDAWEKGITGHTRYRDLEGEWICAASPVFDTKGRIVGVYESGTNFYIHEELRKIVMKRIITGICIAAVIMLGIFLFFSYILLSSIKKIHQAGKLFAAGDFSVRININTHDEIEDLGNRFNVMADSIENHLSEIERRMNTMETMNQIDKTVLSSISRNDLLDKVIKIILSMFSDCSIAVISGNKEKNGFDIFAYEKNLSKNIFGEMFFIPDEANEYIFLRSFQVILSSVDDEEQSIPGNFKKLIGHDFKSMLNIPIFISDGYLGSLLIGKLVDTGFSTGEVESITMLADQVGVAMSSIQAFEEKEKLFLGILVALSQALDAKSRWSAGHSERVAKYAEQIGRKMGLDEPEVRMLSISAILHDIGKIGVPEQILDKDDVLTKEEYAIIRMHPEKGAEMIIDISAYDKIVPGILCHHEQWDGNGYPFGLKGEEIPLKSRIISVADVYDAITADRPYRKGMDLETAIVFIYNNSGKMFDPVIVGIFIDILRES